jgi:hypothetical protein
MDQKAITKMDGRGMGWVLNKFISFLNFAGLSEINRWNGFKTLC